MKTWILVSIVLFLSLSNLIVVDGRSKLSLKITKFHTYSYRRLDGRCCGDHDNADRYGLCSKTCLPKFKMCLERYDVNVSLTDPRPYAGKCEFGIKESLVWGKSDLEFSKQYIYSYHFDIQSSWPIFIMMIIEAYDVSNRGPYNDAVIDRVFYRSMLKPTLDDKSDKEWHLVTLPNGASIYEFSLRLVCQKHYFGVSCDKYCKSGTDDSGHKCDDHGNKICRQGWMGSNCNISICKPGCHNVHGFCNKPGECLCTEGWKGPFCDECMKYPGCVHGTCVDSPWTCYCQPNWGGYFCDKSLNYCGENNPCKNGGICENQPSQTSPYKCICPSGFEGKNCEINHCSPNPCKKGTCIKSRDGYYCDCLRGWTGKICEFDQNTCDSSTCKNGGKCQKDENGSFQCNCPMGFRGSECHISVSCDNPECKHVRECKTRPHQQQACVCMDGWRGKYCDQDINECDSSPCKNGGICKNTNGSYKCQCKDNFMGNNCEINVACHSKPCKNGGVCQEKGSDFVCKCKPDYSGQFCEVYKTGCSPNPCRNGAYCYTLERGIYCQCPPDYWGKHCEHTRPYCGREPCSSAYDACFLQKSSGNNLSKPVCGLHGTCVSKGDREFECKCGPGFEGRYCEKNIDDCQHHQCENNGVCVDGINDYECLCENGFGGKRCEERIDYCGRNPCMNGGQCKSRLGDTYNDFSCDCTSIWGGRLCQVPSHGACDLNPCLHEGSCTTDLYLPGSFKCECKPGWMGSICQIRDERWKPCQKNNPCKNNGVCLNVGDWDYTCYCSGGFEGKNCELDTNECHPNPCFNGGKCVDLINSYRCDCPNGFYGTQCQSNFDECTANPCTYGSVCVDRIDGFECRCPEGRSGQLCDQIINNQKPPQPPSCVYYNRIFDSGQHWSYNCQNCKCDMGRITCKKTKCGVWSCLKSEGPDDPYECKHDEICHKFPFEPTRCFVSPCVQKAMCVKRNREVPSTGVSWPGETDKGCRPNGNQKNNNCAQILLKFEKSNMPVGVTVDEICESLKRLPVIGNYKQTALGESLSISCDVNEGNPSIINVAIYSMNNNMFLLKSTNSRRPFVHFLSDKMADNLIEVVRQNYSILTGLVDIKVETLLLQSDVTDQSSLMKFLLIPLVLVGVFIVIVLIWHHRRKMKEIQECSSKSKFHNPNAQFQAVPNFPNARQAGPTMGPLQTKYMAFTGDKIHAKNVPPQWSQAQHPFNG